MAKGKKSAGILAYRIKDAALEVLLVHPGGPFFAKKDIGTWSIPKGEFEEDEDALAAAKREFLEETGYELGGSFRPLSPIVLKAGKTVFAWAIEQDINTALCKSNTFELEWPHRSGKHQSFPEVDKAEWFQTSTAIEKINAAQVALIHELINILDHAGSKVTL